MIKALYKQMKKSGFRSKKGVTLIELVVTIVVMCIVITGVASGIVISQDIIVNNNLRDLASSQAQTLTDELMEMVKGVSPQTVSRQDMDYLLKDSDAKQIDTSAEFDGEQKKQYKITYSSSGSVKGYIIEVAVYYQGDKCVTNKAFSPAEIIR